MKLKNKGDKNIKEDKNIHRDRIRRKPPVPITSTYKSVDKFTDKAKNNNNNNTNANNNDNIEVSNSKILIKNKLSVKKATLIKSKNSNTNEAQESNGEAIKKDNEEKKPEKKETKRIFYVKQIKKINLKKNFTKKRITQINNSIKKSIN